MNERFLLNYSSDTETSFFFFTETASVKEKATNEWVFVVDRGVGGGTTHISNPETFPVFRAPCGEDLQPNAGTIHAKETHGEWISDRQTSKQTNRHVNSMTDSEKNPAYGRH